MSLNRDWDLVELPEQPPVTTSEMQTTVSEKSATVISNVSSGTDTVTIDKIREEMKELLHEEVRGLKEELRNAQEETIKRVLASLKIDDESRRKKQQEINFNIFLGSCLFFILITVVTILCEGNRQPSEIKSATVISNVSTGVDNVTLDEIQEKMKKLLHEEVRALTEELRNQYNNKVGENFSVQEETIKRALVSHKQEEKRIEAEKSRADAPYVILLCIFFVVIPVGIVSLSEGNRRSSGK